MEPAQGEQQGGDCPFVHDKWLISLWLLQKGKTKFYSKETDAYSVPTLATTEP